MLLGIEQDNLGGLKNLHNSLPFKLENQANFQTRNRPAPIEPIAGTSKRSTRSQNQQYNLGIHLLKTEGLSVSAN